MKATDKTRAWEINLLQQLKGDTYFGQVFSNEAIDTMCDNIKNDFMIGLGVDVFAKAEQVRKAEHNIELQEKIIENHRVTIANLKDQKDNLVALIFKAMYTDAKNETIESELHEILGMKETCVYKLRIGATLSDTERAAMIYELTSKK